MKFRAAFVQLLKPKLPPVQLNVQLIDVTGDLRALRLILGDPTLQIRNGRNGGGAGFCCVPGLGRWHVCRLSAVLTIKSKFGRRAIDNKRRRTMVATEINISGWRLVRIEFGALLHRV